jgi:putative endonuclease
VKAYYVYLMTNRSRVVFYTGVRNDLMRRVWEHQNGAAKGFTEKYKLTILVHQETYNDIRDAGSREKEIKGWRRNKKNALVEASNPKWIDLSPTLDPQCEVPRRLSGSG